jgi:hypothetical protein
MVVGRKAFALDKIGTLVLMLVIVIIILIIFAPKTLNAFELLFNRLPAIGEDCVKPAAPASKDSFYVSSYCPSQISFSSDWTNAKTRINVANVKIVFNDPIKDAGNNYLVFKTFMKCQAEPPANQQQWGTAVSLNPEIGKYNLQIKSLKKTCYYLIKVESTGQKQVNPSQQFISFTT